jgi:ribosomal protein S18 acetylase RimI-like enzyme
MIDKSSIEIIRADLSIPAHGDAIVSLMDEYAKDPMGGGNGLSDYAKTNLIAKLRQINNVHIIIAFIDRQPAGLVNCFQGFSTFACQPLLNIHDVIVSSNYRGNGLSKIMLAAVEKIAIDLGCCKLTLEVLEGNQIAKQAYRSCGFEGFQLDPEMGKALFWEKKL